LVNKKQQAGNYSIAWDGTDDMGKLCPSGIYLYKISTKTFQATKKMILLQ
jgi:flagellar hook assembly protein FlgD